MSDKIVYTDYGQCISALLENADKKYDLFNNPIVNSTYRTVGVRTPVIRQIAKRVDLACRPQITEDFFADPDKTYESVLFAGCLAARKGDYAETRRLLERLIPLFGSWAHVDCVISSLKWVDVDRFLTDFRYLLDSKGQYEVRSYIIFMFSCLTEERIDRVLTTLRNIRYGEYYIDMAAAWLLAECLVKFYDKTVCLFETVTFPKFVHNKAIQKARESYRIPPDVKEYLNGLKIKTD